MKKSIRKVIVMALALMLAMTTIAQADTIISPTFRLPGAETRPTEEPAVEPTETPAEDIAGELVEDPTEDPAADPEEEPITLNVSCNLAGRTTVPEGTLMVLTLDVEGAEGRDYTIRWQQTKDGVTWEDIPGANGYQYTLELKVEHSGMYWRACLDMADNNTGE